MLYLQMSQVATSFFSLAKRLIGWLMVTSGAFIFRLLVQIKPEYYRLGDDKCEILEETTDSTY